MSGPGATWASSQIPAPPPAFPTPSVPSPTDERPGPSRLGFALAGILLVVGILAAGSGVSDFLGFGNVVADFARVDVPGETELTLEAGEYVVYYEAPGGGGMPPLDLEIHPANGTAPVDLRRPSGSMDYQVGGYSGVSVWEFTVHEPGSHRFEVSAEERFGQLAIGAEMFGDLFRTVFSILGGFGAFFLALIVAVITAVRRSRHRRRATAHPAPPYASAAQPPLGW